MEPKKRVTFDDIAAYTHFSKTTISRYFNNPDSLTPKSQQIIADALKTLHYKENKVARILANGKTEFIGIIVPDLYHHYFFEILSNILATYESFGYKFLVFTGNRNEDIERRYIRELLSYQIEGMIVLSHTIASEELAKLPIPIVTIEREDEFVSSVNTDNFSGGCQAAEMLDRHNCDRLIHINSPADDHKPSAGRIHGFESYCKQHQVPHEILLRGFDNSYENDLQLAKEVFEQIENSWPREKKGLFIANDTLANLFLKLIFQKYGCLPEDYLLVGFDNSNISRESIISISTIGQQVDQLTHEAVALLIDQIEQHKTKTTPAAPVHKVIPPVLFERETTNRNPNWKTKN